MAAFAARGAGALPTGDTCTASGSGNAYTLTITIPGSAPQQSGFAVGAPGATITTVRSNDASGASSKTGLPAFTAVAWLSQTPMLPGTVTLQVVTGGPVKEFRLDAASSPPGSYIDRFNCVVSPSTAPIAPSAFTALHVATYDAANGKWHERVSIPAAGVVSATQQLATNQVMAARPLVEASKIVAHTSGTYALTLSLTGAGRKAIAAHRVLSVKLGITFAATNGTHSARMVHLMLRR